METVEILGYRAKVARTFFERAKGLIGTKALGPDEGMLILSCNAIHTFFMSFPIDAIFLDRNDRIVSRVNGIPPWRPLVFGGFKAVKVLEVRASGQPGV